MNGETEVCVQSVKQKKILLVEDNVVNCEVAIDMLEELGYDVDVVHNGQQAIDAFDIEKHALILMDCEMPVMNGFSATEIIRQQDEQEKRSSRPIIALTAHAITGAKDRCFDSGMDDFLSKPFSMKTLQMMLSKWLPEQTDAADVADLDELMDVPQVDFEVLDYSVINQLKTRQKKGNLSLADKLLTIYLDQSSRLLSDLKLASQNADIDTIREISHALKSSSINVGARKFSALCKEVELSCEQGAIINSLVDQVFSSYLDVEKALKDVLSQSSEHS